MDCLFCKIVNKEIPSYVIYEDEYVICFLDIHPIKMGHTLIVPKKHFIDNDDINNEYLLKIHESSKKIVNLINEKLHPIGYRLIQNNGCEQEIKHYHLHIIPTYEKNTKKYSVEEISNLLTK